MLLHRVGAERAAAADGSHDGPCPAHVVIASAFDGDRDLGANRGAIALHADQVHVDPVVALAGILEQPQGVTVRGHRAANLRDDVLVAVAVEIGEGDAVSLVQLARAGRGGDAHERLALLVQQQLVRQDRSKRRAAHAEIHVEVAVVVDVAEVGGHRHQHLVQPDLGGDVAERPVSEIAIQLRGLRVVRHAEVGPQSGWNALRDGRVRMGE